MNLSYLIALRGINLIYPLTPFSTTSRQASNVRFDFLRKHNRTYFIFIAIFRNKSFQQLGFLGP